MVVLGISHSSCISSIITVNLKGLKLQISAFYYKFKFSCDFNKTIIDIFMITMIKLKKVMEPYWDWKNKNMFANYLVKLCS